MSERYVAPAGEYLNNIIEADHGKLKQLIRPVRCLKTLKTACATIKGFEVMRALRKGQAAVFNITRDIHGEARPVERAFGFGVSGIAEAVQFVSERLKFGGVRETNRLHPTSLEILQQSRSDRALSPSLDPGP